MSDKKDFYINLKIQLNDTTEFPADYMYKFIVPTDGDQLEKVKSIFDFKGAVIKTRNSKTGKYVSSTIVLKLNSADEVISYYKKVENIKGIISL